MSFGAQYLDKSVETPKAERSNLVNHDAVSVPVACHLEPEWPCLILLVNGQTTAMSV
jgi:hypothetical protein